MTCSEQYHPDGRRDDYAQPRQYDSRPYDDRGGYGRDDRQYQDPRGAQPRWDERDRPQQDRDFRAPPAHHDHYDDGYDRGYGGGVPPPRRDDYSHPPQRQQEAAYPSQRPDPSYSEQYPQQHQQPNQHHYQPPQGHSPYQPPDDGRFQSHQRESRVADSRQPVNTEPPSASVVLLGLPATADDLALRNFLEDMGASIDSTTVIKDRATGLSKRYGFAKFSSVEHARAFVEPNFPVVTWRDRGRPGPDDGIKIKINFSQKTGGWREDQGAGARMTEDQRKAAGAFLPKQDSVMQLTRDLTDVTQAPMTFYVNDGTRDIGSAPTQILLLRGLDPLTSEEDITTSLSNIIGRPGNLIREGTGVKKVLITKDRASRTSWGYAFVQFADVRLATEVLANAFNPNLYPTGYRIRNSVVAFSFCHENSFVPIYAKSEWSFKGEGGQQLAYWDDKAFVNAWIPPTKGVGAVELSSKKASVDDLGDADMDAFFSSIEAETPASAAVGPASTAPQRSTSAPQVMAPSQPAVALALAAPGAPGAVSFKMKTNTGTEAEERLKAIMKARKQKEAASETNGAAAAALLQADKKKGELIQSKKAAVNINKWNTKQQELKAPEETIDPSPSTTTPALAPTVFVHSESPIVVAHALTVLSLLHASITAFGQREHIKFGYSPRVAVTSDRGGVRRRVRVYRPRSLCLLALSTTIQTNLKVEATVAAARLRKIESLKTQELDPQETGTAAPQYVDRAAARRQVHHQPDHPVPEAKRRKLAADGPPPPPPPPEQPNKNGIEESNVGAKMLQKMGWSAGAGLGSTGSGIIAPIEASQFQQGAGLGSTKGGFFYLFERAALIVSW
ncbi:hypothetical protein P7C70_g438, partial [Phenoliferia sp. Uapishka_3]